MKRKLIAFPNCNETFMDIEKVMDSCRRLAEANNYFYNFSTAYAKHDKMIKFADYVAAGRRKVDENKLKTIKCFEILDGKIDGKHFNIVFR